MYGINRSEFVFEITCYGLAASIEAKFQVNVPIAASEISEAGLVHYTSKNLFYFRALGLPIRLNYYPIIQVTNHDIRMFEKKVVCLLLRLRNIIILDITK